jgi:dTDP-4-dehydrorhamnose reductase
MDTIIVLGCNGMLGSYISSYFGSKMNVINISRNDYDALSDIIWLKKILLKKIPKGQVFVFNAIGLIPQRKSFEKTKEHYFRINGFFPKDLSNLCQEMNWKLIHPSTDCVFNGSSGNYNVHDETDATDLYGISKSMADSFLKNTNTCIIRTSIIGEEKNNTCSLLEWVKNTKDNINGYTNIYWNGITCLEYAKLLYNLITSNNLWCGIKHIISPECISKYQLIEYINEIYNCKLKITPIVYEKNKNKCLCGNIITQDIYTQLIELSNYNF